MKQKSTMLFTSIKVKKEAYRMASLYLCRSDLNETREYCMDKIDDLEEEARKNKEHLDIIDENLLFVENDGTNRYHKLDCFKFKGKDFKVFEVGSLRLKDYVACPFCY